MPSILASCNLNVTSMISPSTICPCILPRCAARVATTSRIRSLHTAGIALRDAPRQPGFERNAKDRYPRPAEGGSASDRTNRSGTLISSHSCSVTDSAFQLGPRTVKRERRPASLSMRGKYSRREQLAQTSSPSWSTFNSKSSKERLADHRPRSKFHGIHSPSIRYIPD